MMRNTLLAFLLADSLSLQMNGEVGSVGQHDSMVDITGGSVTDEFLQRLVHLHAVVRMNEMQKRFEGPGKLRRTDADQATKLIRHGEPIGSGVPVPIADTRDALG